MNYSDQLRFIASALMPDVPDTAVMLESIAIGVRRLERFAEETVSEAHAEELLRARIEQLPPRRNLRVVS